MSSGHLQSLGPRLLCNSLEGGGGGGIQINEAHICFSEPHRTSTDTELKRG